MAADVERGGNDGEAEEDSAADRDGAAEGFTAEERAAIKERAREVRATKKRGKKKDLEPDVLAKIAEMPEPDRSMARRVHEIVRASAPELTCRLWYGMPAYSLDGKVLCFFQGADKFSSRYATLGFNDVAHLDDGSYVADVLRSDHIDRGCGGPDR